VPTGMPPGICTIESRLSNPLKALDCTGTLAIGEAGAKNAGLLAAAILALGDKDLSERLQDWRAAKSAAVVEVPEG
jgi:phosphoribosylcarboxyaminoimidazole (NCAIR) mutase